MVLLHTSFRWEPETPCCYFSTVIPTGLAELVAIMSYLWAYLLPQRSQRPDHVGKCYWSACPHVFSYSKTKPFLLPPSPTPMPLPHSLLGRWPSLASLHDTNYLSNLQDEISHPLKAVLWLLTHPSIPTPTPASEGLSSQITNTWCSLSPLQGVKMAVPKPCVVSRGLWTPYTGLIFASCPSSPVFDTADSQTPCTWWCCYLMLKDNCSVFWFYIWMETLTLRGRISF